MVQPQCFVTLVALGLLGAFGSSVGRGSEKPAPASRPAPSLKVGDPAPALTASVWLQGEKVKAFKPGRVYVIEFWSTTCAPCIAFMARLAELQKRYQKNGVTVIGCTAAAFGDTQEKAAAFVTKRGPALGYRFALAEDRTFAAWMTAAGRQGIPCTFVVDQAGRVAYIGHPMFLGLVLDMVVAGTSTAKEIGAEVGKMQDDFAAVSGTLSFGPAAHLQALKGFESKYPALADFYPAMKSKLTFLPKYGRPGEAKQYAEGLLTKAIERDDRLVLGLVSALLRQSDAKADKALIALAVKAAEAEVRITGGKDASTLISLADAYFISRDETKAREVARQAVAAAAEESPSSREYVEKEAKRFGAEK